MRPGALLTAGMALAIIAPGAGDAWRDAPRTAAEARTAADADSREREALLARTRAQARRLMAEADTARGTAAALRVARSLADTVHVLWGLEDYATALPFAERALAIREQALDGGHPDVAASLYQLGELRRATGDYAGALRAHRSAAAIWEKALGPGSPELASALHYLGVLHLTTGDRAGARALLERALAIRETGLGPSHDLVATTLTALADVLAQGGDRAQAGLLLERAQAIWERVLGPEHPHVARCLTLRAELLEDEGDLGGARPLLERGRSIRARAFGEEHYLTARSLSSLADLLARSGEPASAEARYTRALEIQRRTLGPGHREVASTLASLARLQWSTGRPEAALENTLQAEAIARAHFRGTARDLAHDEAVQYETIRTSGMDVALSILAAGGVPPAAVGRIVDELIRSRAIVLDLLGKRPPAAPGWLDLRRVLPRGGALVGYVRYRRTGGPGGEAASTLAPAPTAASAPAEAPGAPEYLAIVLTAGEDGPVAVPLGSAARIEALVAAWRREVSADPRLRDVIVSEREYRAAGRRLREAIWEPLAPALAGARQVFVVPDAAISLVSLETLPAGDDRYLAETGPRVHYLSAERDLVLDRSAGASGGGVLVVGGPDFDAPRTARANADIETGDRAGQPAHGAAPLCPEFNTRIFEPLPGSRTEAEQVASLWTGTSDVATLTGAQAGEAAFKAAVPGRRILHLATHAYFLSERCGAMGWQRSGLVLAGANRRGDPGEVPAADDGILTAEEIAGLDLPGVEWAVLSACDTGAGDVYPGEGVVGLRRAFEVAGAHTVIMSLWAVDDGAARVWMRGLYEHRLAGRSTTEAVTDAGVEMLAAQRRAGRTTHPFFWGAFVATGDWR